MADWRLLAISASCRRVAGDGIARIHGLDEVMAGELVEFEEGTIGNADFDGDHMAVHDSARICRYFRLNLLVKIDRPEPSADLSFMGL
ncbi:hypothetical protein F0562_028174 [Nyssa sinensis]|uniref:Uncharacterized protein n=1 Tax=Nyssa sinensis TaxID=561372 RepID=A0A5J5B9L0_9ASTE|nr:hypothetical protein F0562_028174 [Nyssa sinensis]